MKGLIFNINRYAIHDGPGIRITFFMKGCPLGCWWCHNPEGISPLQQVAERVDRIGDREFRVNEEVGKYYTVDEVIGIVEKERVFIEESGGGVTFSGGEPLMQSKFLAEALSALQDNGIHTTVDTSGQADRSVIDTILDNTDLFLFDIKHLDPEKHRNYTGVSNRQILENYRSIIEKGKKVFIRIPVIPGYNDDDEHLENLLNFIEGYRGSSLSEIDLLPYHKIGSSKYRRFGMEFKMNGVDQPSYDRMIQLKEYFASTGIKVKIGG